MAKPRRRVDRSPPCDDAQAMSRDVVSGLSAAGAVMSRMYAQATVAGG